MWDSVQQNHPCDILQDKQKKALKCMANYKFSAL